MNLSHVALPALWLISAAAAALAVWLARRFAGGVSWKIGALLALLPLLFTGKAILLGQLYGPADLYDTADPWKAVAAERGISGVANPILTDLAYSYLPWRAALRESVANGRVPLWNRFILAGTPLLATSQPGVFHPSTWLGIFLPLPLSWTFSCAFTLFLGLLCAYVFFRDFRLRPLPSLIGAVAWGFSTYLVFWNGYSSGPSTASLPLLLLGLRRIAAGGRNGVGLTVAGLALSVFGGHPESYFHCVAAGGVYFLWELWPRRRDAAPRAAGAALGAGVLAFFISAPQLFPLLEALPRSAEYQGRREPRAASPARQSVAAPQAAPRLLPAILPFAHGIYGKSPVQGNRNDGSGMPLAYGGAVLFPLAVHALARRRPHPDRGRSIFLAFFLAGVLFGASAPGLIDLVSLLPGFSMALNYRLVFLSALGIAGLAAFGAQRLCDEDSARGLAVASAAIAAALLAVFFSALGVFRDRGLPGSFVGWSAAWEILPVAALAAASFLLPARPRALLAAALGLLAVQRAWEMGCVYPTVPAESLAPPLPTLAKLPPDGPFRVAAAGAAFRPNGAAFYGLEDVRGYESIILSRFARTVPLWGKSEPGVSAGLDDLGSPFLSFLNVRFAIAPPGAAAPAGWKVFASGPELTLLENPRCLPRAYAPGTLLFESDPEKTLAEMSKAQDFSEAAWLRSEESGRRTNGPADVSSREIGSDLEVSVSSPSRVFLATSIPDWPGWRAESSGREIDLTTVNHAFVGFWLEAGRHIVRLRYRPVSFPAGIASLAVGLVIAASLARRRARR